MTVTFESSARSTVGIEWELALVDKDTCELANVAPEILAELEPVWRDRPGSGQLAAELLQNTIEIVSAPHTRVADAVADLRALAHEVLAAADRRGLALIASGCHPFSNWRDQLTTDSERYRSFMETTGWWGRNMLIWGVHTHLGVEDQRRVIPLMHALLAYQPHLIALSASSPLWDGEITGYASNRTMLFQQLSSAGIPFDIDTWEDFEEVLGDMKTAGIISQANEARWDIRPAPKWGTLEVRTCDGASTLNEIGALTAFSQCLIEEFTRRIDRGAEPPRLAPWFVRENKWRAARYGLDAQVIVDDHGRQMPLREHLDGVFTRLRPIADELGCKAELDTAAELASSGSTSAERQMRVFRQHGGEGSAEAGREVVRLLMREFRESL